MCGRQNAVASAKQVRKEQTHTQYRTQENGRREDPSHIKPYGLQGPDPLLQTKKIRGVLEVTFVLCSLLSTVGLAWDREPLTVRGR
jgi:hypothetical protein